MFRHERNEQMAYIHKRTDSTGKVKYRVQVRLKGHPIQSATFARRTDAKIWGQKTEAELRDKKYFGSNEAKNKTLSDMIDRYLELGHCILAELNKSLISEKVEKLSRKIKTRTTKQDAEIVNSDKKPKISPSRVNRYMAALSHAFTIAINEWEWLDHNPMSKISKLKEPRGRTRYLEDDERARLLDACKNSECKHLYLIVILAISTGARRMEILSLRWKDIDFERGQFILHETKNGERRTLPLTGLALSLMNEHHIWP